MAKAPTPGDRRSGATIFLRVRVRKDEWLVPPPRFLPVRDKIAVRAATSLPYEAFITASNTPLGDDALCVLYWLGRRGAGESLSFEQATREWEALELSDDDVDVEWSVPEASDPEA